MAQRPMYAGSGPKGRPGLASRFKDPDEATSVPVSNRVGDTGTTARIPVDALGDADLVNRLNQWPREHRPFWLLNADHIEAARSRSDQNLESRSGFQQNGVQSETRPIRPSLPRSPFLGQRT
ncbi:hypothetical protein BDFB_000874 [Asbolus verrucosus]|uniref:Uncharacterized protein n=1 Tax=Asbolus verrucosus TaxID=1661398 RepID=A0A482V978_ASBVE|nr:hypothetical protein BDFB_000874 [Asbolus verrucosus]